jgi:hypothetical protein
VEASTVRTGGGRASKKGVPFTRAHRRTFDFHQREAIFKFFKTFAYSKKKLYLCRRIFGADVSRSGRVAEKGIRWKS